VPRREMLDAPFANLEADYRSLLDRRHDRSGSSPRRPGRRSLPSTASSV
jgi:hypothetical protein